MALERLTKITSFGISTTANIRAGIATFNNNVVVGGATTALVVTGNARITGILTVGTGSITINPTTDSISGVTTLGVTTAYVTSINDGPLSGARNIIINGAMDINQRGFTGAAGTTTTGAYVTDRFRIEHVHDGAVSAGQTSMNSTIGGNAFADGFKNALYFTVTTADASLAAGQLQAIEQRIEGFNVQGIKKGTANALPVTLSFWVRSTTTGTYIAELYDYDNTRQVSKAYTINAANTWEKKVLTFPADTVGAFDNDNALSFEILWWLAAGSSYSGGTLNTSWAGITTANRAAGQVNLLGTINNNFWLTGVQLEVGSQATPFERRSYGQELALCQRYYWKNAATSAGVTNGLGNGHQTSLTGSQIQVFYPVTMRAAPTVTFSNLIVSDYTSYDADVSSVGVSASTTNSTNIGVVHASAGAQYRPSTLRTKGSGGVGFIDFSVEL